jgi:hypothetical protein
MTQASEEKFSTELCSKELYKLWLLTELIPQHKFTKTTFTTFGEGMKNTKGKGYKG